MKNIKIVIIILSLFLTLSACKPIKNVDDKGEEIEEHFIEVEKIEKIHNMEISDWLNDETVVISKENNSVDKMELLELSEYYPRSLYLYNINTKESKLLKEERNLFLGGATFSEDKNHLLYYEYALGDPAYYVMNIDTLDSFGVRGDNIGGAISARWDGNQVIGVTYSNKIYEASSTGEIIIIEDINEEGLYIARKVNDNIYYNTYIDENLIMINQDTKESIDLNIKHVYDLIPSPDGNKMLVLQNNGTKSTMIICDTDGSNQKTIAEGEEIEGVSWSPDNQMVAYNLQSTVNNTTVNDLYIYDVLAAESTQLETDIQNVVSSSWSPTGDKLVYVEWDGEQYTSSVVYLKLPLKK
ncbi:hypothetical protein [Tissierella sp. Yu-01]|uniref:hypothetical protein n=1 Tax=Tissierella sp. Yu-01 TaxID=3035694 RepID=UPI00240DDE56|nr:hypothetical protein [Tissierella sp. Yu-01]WFA09301.1 hypothetical protein P3962_01630 [Tissierella sp. Yu-01]